MSNERLLAGASPRIRISGRGDVRVIADGERYIVIGGDGNRLSGQLDKEITSDQPLQIAAHDDLVLRVPSDSLIELETVHGDVFIDGVAVVSAREIKGDAQLRAIRNDVRLEQVHGDIQIDGAARFSVENRMHFDSGDLDLRNVETVSINNLGGDASIAHVYTVSINNVGGDCRIEDVAETASCNGIGGDLDLGGQRNAQLSVGTVGGDVRIHGGGSVKLGQSGGDAEIREISGNVVTGAVGGDLQVVCGGDFALGSSGGDVRAEGRGALRGLGAVGGDLELEIGFAPDGSYSGTIGGDAHLIVPSNAGVTINATVGGEVHGSAAGKNRGAFFRQIYGDGKAALSLLVGGDLIIDGDASRTASGEAEWREFPPFEQMGTQFGQMGAQLGQIGAQLGRDLGQIGAQISRDVADAFRNQPHNRVSVQGQARQWQIAPERVEHLKAQARAAAQDGIAGAMEAIDRALNTATPPFPPAPPAAPAPAAPPMPPAATGDTIRMDAAQMDAATAPAAQPETERAAVLQMVAEGRISPEEGDMLLDALER